MKGIYFTFDAFGEWLEHYGVKMWWMVKGRGKLRPKLGRSTITFLFLLHYYLLYLSHHHFGK
jgi:hypothetical protein